MGGGGSGVIGRVTVGVKPRPQPTQETAVNELVAPQCSQGVEEAEKIVAPATVGTERGCPQFRQ